MKVLFVSQYFYPETFRGNDIVFDLIEKGHEVTVLTGKPNYPLGKFFEGYSFWGIKKEIINGANVIRIPTFPRGNGGAVRLILNYLSFFIFSFPYSRFKLDTNFDIIFVQQLSPVTMAIPGIWAKKRNQNAKLYIWVLDLWPESVTAITGLKNKFIISLIDRLVKYIYSRADYILISSNSFKESIKQRSRKKEIIYFPNWAESIYELNTNVRCNLGNLPKGFNIMFAGNIGEAQDFETILKASELTKEERINWIIVGDGRKLNWVKEQVMLRSMKNVHIFGRHPIESMPAFFKNADVMLLTLKDSSVSNLTVPAKLQAYMASGKIILGAISGEANSIINNNDIGKSCESGNFNKLAENAILLKNLSKEERIEIEKNSKNLYLLNYSKSVLLNNLEISFKNNCNIE
jgi:glycosyltransferase involved in cell wall biosynthesis